MNDRLRPCRGWRRAVSTSVLLVCWAALAGHAQARRVALLVGNDAYDPGRLTFPAQDVEEMRKALLAAGFAASDIQAERNADQRRLRRAIQEFGRRAQGADVAFFYFSGHGAQVQGQNWLVPVGAEIHTEGGYELEAVSAQAVLSQLSVSRPRVAVVVLDACRDNPLAVNRSGTKGLARMEAGDRTLLAFATAPNDTAADTGLYARVLARHLQTPGMELLDAFRNTTADVRRKTNGRQVPRVSEVTLDERVVLLPAATSAPMPAASPPVATESPLKLDDIEAAQQSRQQGVRQLAQMQRDFDRVVSLTADPDLQQTAWERFLSAWIADIPSTTTDETLRDQARMRLLALRQRPVQDTSATTGTVVPPPQQAAASTPAPPPEAPPPTLAMRVGQVLTYRITDLYTNNSRLVKLRLSKVDGEQFEFDNGAREEGPGAARDAKSPPVLGALDEFQPPGGWWKALIKPGRDSKARYRNLDGSAVDAYRTSEQRSGSHKIGSRVVVTEIAELRGTVEVNLGMQRHDLKGVLHYASDLQRVVRLDLEVQGPRASSLNRDVRERIELIAMD